MDAQLDMLRDLHARTMMCFPNSERMYESVVDLSDALCAQSHFAEAKSLLGRFTPLAFDTLGHGHIVTLQLRYNHAHALYMYHFFGYDGYIADCEVAIRLLEQLREHVVSFRCDARDQLDLYNVYESTRELLAKAQNYRLE